MKSRQEYEAKGYADAAASGSFRISECPYSDGWQRDAWQAGAWRWMEEQRKLKKERAVPEAKKSKAQIEREIKVAIARRDIGVEPRGISPHLFRKARWNLYDAGAPATAPKILLGLWGYATPPVTASARVARSRGSWSSTPPTAGCAAASPSPITTTSATTTATCSASW